MSSVIMATLARSEKSVTWKIADAPRCNNSSSPPHSLSVSRSFCLCSVTVIIRCVARSATDVYSAGIFSCVAGLCVRRREGHRGRTGPPHAHPPASYDISSAGCARVRNRHTGTPRSGQCLKPRNSSYYHPLAATATTMTRRQRSDGALIVIGIVRVRNALDTSVEPTRWL